VSKCDKVFFPTKKKDAFLKKIAIIFSEKREFVKKNPLLFFLRVLTHNFERIHHETNWSDSGLGGLFYFILFLI
jgi:hypothetical protein